MRYQGKLEMTDANKIYICYRGGVELLEILISHTSSGRVECAKCYLGSNEEEENQNE